MHKKRPTKEKVYLHEKRPVYIKKGLSKRPTDSLSRHTAEYAVAVAAQGAGARGVELGEYVSGSVAGGFVEGGGLPREGTDTIGEAMEHERFMTLAKQQPGWAPTIDGAQHLARSVKN